MTTLGQKEETDLGDVGSGGDVNQVIFPVHIEGIIPSELKQTFKDLFEIPGISRLEKVTTHLGLWRHGFEIGHHRVGQGAKLLAGDQFNPIDQQIGKLPQRHVRTPLLPPVLMARRNPGCSLGNSG